jgi:hypothetical protein
MGADTLVGPNCVPEPIDGPAPFGLMDQATIAMATRRLTQCAAGAFDDQA